MALTDLSAAIEMAACSDTGLVRSLNEDSILPNASLGLAVLADGMGGYNAGEVASGMATALLGSELEEAFTLRPPHEIISEGQTWAQAALAQTIEHANTAIYRMAQSQPQYAGMGTTLVAVQFHDNRLTVAHIGDSRLYRLRGEEFRTLTRDHSFLQEQIDSGLLTPEQARHSRNKNLVTRALGVEPGVATEFGEHTVLPEDIYLLCSDGLNDMVDDDEIALTLSTLAANLPLCARHLVQTANDYGGRDNVSVILARIRQPFPAGGLWQRMQSWFG